MTTVYSRAFKDPLKKPRTDFLLNQNMSGYVRNQLSNDLY